MVDNPTPAVEVKRVTPAVEQYGPLSILPVSPTPEQREIVRASDLYKLGDARLAWVNEGDLSCLLLSPPSRGGEMEKLREAAIRAALCLSGFVGEGICIADHEDPETAYGRVCEAIGLPYADEDDLRAALASPPPGEVDHHQTNVMAPVEIGPVTPVEGVCGHCNGAGDIDHGDHPCFTCGGSGRVAVTKPANVQPDWLNAATCIENMQIAYDDALEADPFDDGNPIPTDTVVDAGDLGVLIVLARFALAASPATPAGSVREGKLGWDADGMCDDHYRFGCPKCALHPVDSRAQGGEK